MRRIPGLLKVRDFHAPPSKDIASMVEGMGRGGGFMAKNLFDVADTLASMCGREGCTKFLSFPAAIMATGTRGVIIDMVRAGMVDAIVTTCGTLDHDISRTLADYYEGSFDMDDARLLRAGYHRLGNVLVPLDNYGPLIEKRMQSILTNLYAKGIRSVTTEELSAEIGKDLGSAKSLLYWAQKKHVPVFVPGITDGAVGSQIWLFAESHRDFRVDLIGDERRLSDITSESKETGALVLGGGISKHHVIWWNLFRGGLDWACYITTASEFDGSLSGAHLREAISWGKVKENAKQASIYAEVTTVLPFIVSYVLTKRGGLPD
ncbi:MAG TPA: deoxyhypusine synthase [Nitrososphaerales archaeon]|nr:deoxyhypusine synthase [Nitrososphaerales archaeon]